MSGTTRPWEEHPEGMQVLYGDWSDQYRIHYRPDVVYKNEERPLKLQMLTMRNPIPGKKYPAVLYITGSGWQTQEIYDRLPQLVDVARCGYVVASMEYRNTDEGFRFPAQIEDAKSAIRYLRAHAEEYQIDPDRIAVWGDSSGAHTALLAGFTEDDAFSVSTDPDYSAKVSCIVDFFAPVDLAASDEYWSADFPATVKFWDADDPLCLLFGNGDKHAVAVERANVLRYIPADRALPPVLILHGDHDTTVHLRQSAKLYSALREAGQQADFFAVRNAAHGYQFWTREIMDTVIRFLKAHL